MKRCIICKKIKNSNDFNKEHIIPESIGGSLTIDNVCKDCNSKLGKEIDSKITNDDETNIEVSIDEKRDND